MESKVTTATVISPFCTKEVAVGYYIQDFLLDLNYQKSPRGLLKFLRMLIYQRAETEFSEPDRTCHMPVHT